jgi:hypothetical protein
MTQQATPEQRAIALNVAQLAAGANVAVCARLQMLDAGQGRVVGVVAIHSPDGLELLTEHGNHVRTLR